MVAAQGNVIPRPDAAPTVMTSGRLACGTTTAGCGTSGPPTVRSSRTRKDHTLGKHVPPLDPHGAAASYDTLGPVDPPPATPVAASQARDQTGRVRNIHAGLNLPAALAGPDGPPPENEEALLNHVPRPYR